MPVLVNLEATHHLFRLGLGSWQDCRILFSPEQEKYYIYSHRSLTEVYYDTSVEEWTFQADFIVYELSEEDGNFVNSIIYQYR